MLPIIKNKYENISILLPGFKKEKSNIIKYIRPKPIKGVTLLNLLL